ncbi:MAG TPA: S41 family peptidase [Novosphingobium sp.]|nr:S41 family peptidase [Novosphingobium sp.]
MINRRHFLSAAALSGAALAAPAVVRAKRTDSGDIRLLGEILRTLHPGLHRYLTPYRFEAALDRLDSRWQGGATLETRFAELTRFLALIRCGHSYPSFYNQKRAVADRLFTRKDRLPFAFRWIGGQMVVTQNQTDGAALPVGSVIKAIGGVPTEAILARLTPYVRADGGNDGKRRALLSASGGDTIETFDVLYGLVYGPPRGGVFNVAYRAPGAASDAQGDFAPIDLAARQRFIRAIDPRSNQPLWQWDMGSDGIARLTMPGWAVYNSKWDWQGWLNDRLDSLKGARGLIVDLRENEGGNDCGDLILARLAGQDIVRPQVDRLVRYRRVPSALNPYLDTWDDSFRDWGDAAKPFNARFLRLDRADEGVIAAKGPRLAVPMAVLTSPQNSSATFQFASLVRVTGLGTLIGETTGGNRRGINGGAFFFARLPESGIEFDVPLIGYFPQGPQPNAGLDPDIRVAETAEDIAAGRDRAMEAARAHLLRG